MKRYYLGSLFLMVALMLVISPQVFAAGKHDALNCTGCHGIHDAKGNIIFAVEPNKKAVNPRTKKPYEGVTALCLGCHETPENGGMGIMPVSSAMSHPYGVVPNPKVADVPSVFLRNGKLECVGCHDPHPSNPNYKYLRVDTKGGAEMQKFCAICHSAKADVKLTEIKIFNSMDQTKFAKSTLKEKPKVKKRPSKRKR
jgi:predicted CXXCH cytochrome family protein